MISYVIFNINLNTIKLYNYRFLQILIVPLTLFIGINNIIGIIPFCFTLTAQFIFTLSISFNIILFCITLGFLVHLHYFFGILLPNGVPLPISPLLIPIETLSLFSRIISLAVRLSANMISGHTLLHLICDFASIIISNNHLPHFIDLTIFLSILLLLLITILTVVEFGIGILQAYVFMLLTVSYLIDSLVTH